MVNNKQRNRKRKANSSESGSNQIFQHLHHKQERTENDPLNIDLFRVPARLSQCLETHCLYPGSDGLDGLIRATYYKILAFTRFGNTIPESAYAYYVATLCYARLLKLEWFSHRLDGDEAEFVKTVYSSHFTVPRSVGIYLAAFGPIDTQQYGHAKFKMHKPTLTPGGYFGRIKDNMYAYASYPCLGVYEQRMKSDLETLEGIRSWDLPDQYRYEGHSLTPKCLGYKEATVLKPEMRQFLENNLENGKPLRFGNIAYLYRLMSTISSFLRAVPGIVHVKLSAAKRGSLAQVVTVKPNGNENDGYVCSCPFRTHKSIEYLGGVLKFNVNKGREQYTDSKKYKNLLPVQFTADQEVPADVNINTLYELNSWGVLKIASYHEFHTHLKMDPLNLVSLDIVHAPGYRPTDSDSN